VRIVAIVTIHDSRDYLANCLTHLADNGVDFFIVDNESTDGSAELLREARFAPHLAGYRTHPFDGTFDWEGLMRAREEAMAKIDADWVMTVAPDEIIHPYTEESLAGAIARIDRAGYDVVDCNEFVFLPINRDYVVDCPGPQPIRTYYFFEPDKPRLMRIRRRDLDVSHLRSGGHVLEGAPFALAPESFALRHYMFRSQQHALRKYGERRFRAGELGRGWHASRASSAPASFRFPPVDMLETLENPRSRELRRDRPHTLHYWEWPRDAA